MKYILLITLFFVSVESAFAQRIVPYVVNNHQQILNDSYDDFLCNDGEVFHDSLFVAVYYPDTLSHAALKVLKNDVLSDVPLDWDVKHGRIFDLFSNAERLYAVGQKVDTVTNSTRAILAIFENGVWSEYIYPNTNRFMFGTEFNDKLYLFPSYYNNHVCTFENGAFYEATLDSIVDARVYDDKLFFIKSNYSGVYYLDSLGVIHSEEIACDSLKHITVIDGELFVTGTCNDFLFRRTENAEWVFDDLGIDFSGLNTIKLSHICKTQRGYIASFTPFFRSSYVTYYQGVSFELSRKNELNEYVISVINFEGKEFALCRNSEWDGGHHGISTVENGWRHQFLSNGVVNERSYPAFASYLYEYLFGVAVRPPGLGYKNNRVVYASDQLLYGLKGGSVSGVGGLDETGLNSAYSGPVATNYSNDFAQRYNRVWRVKQSEIDYHNAHWWEANYSGPIDILEWPGNGDTMNGEPQILAPFHDVNGNNIYEPQFGDAPEIKGDEATFYIVSDGREVSPRFLVSNFGCTVSKLEMTVMTYLFHNSASAAINNTVFTDYRIILRDEAPLNDFYFGMQSDFLLGTPYDDYVGCDSIRNLVFGYNGDDFDEPSSISAGYLNEVPACGFRVLNNTLHSAVNTISSQNPVYGAPVTIPQMYEVLQGKYKDGSTIINPVNQQGTRFMFSGEVGVPGAWNQVTAGYPGGYGLMIWSVQMGDLLPNQPRCISVARIVASDTLSAGSPAVNAVYKMKQYSDEVQLYYDQYLQITNCDQLVGMEEISQDELGVIVYPNPARSRIVIQTSHSSLTRVEMFNSVGSLVYDLNELKIPTAVIDVNNLATGFYSLRIRLQDGTTAVKKIIVE